MIRYLEGGKMKGCVGLGNLKLEYEQDLRASDKRSDQKDLVQRV